MRDTATIRERGLRSWPVIVHVVLMLAVIVGSTLAQQALNKTQGSGEQIAFRVTEVNGRGPVLLPMLPVKLVTVYVSGDRAIGGHETLLCRVRVKLKENDQREGMLVCNGGVVLSLDTLVFNAGQSDAETKGVGGR
jgi:hypothetical protein